MAGLLQLIIYHTLLSLSLGPPLGCPRELGASRHAPCVSPEYANRINGEVRGGEGRGRESRK